MNKAELEHRIELITHELTQTKAMYVKIEGHLAEAQHWLKTMVEAENSNIPNPEPINETCEEPNGDINSEVPVEV